MLHCSGHSLHFSHWCFPTKYKFWQCCALKLPSLSVTEVGLVKTIPTLPSFSVVCFHGMSVNQLQHASMPRTTVLGTSCWWCSLWDPKRLWLACCHQTDWTYSLDQKLCHLTFHSNTGSLLSRNHSPLLHWETKGVLLFLLSLVFQDPFQTWTVKLPYSQGNSRVVDLIFL